MKKFKKIVLTFVALVIAATTINANPLDGGNQGKEPFTVKYLGNDGDYLLFQVIVNAEDNKDVKLAVSDKTEGEIYSSNIENYKVQTFKIEKRDNQKLDFKLLIGKEEFLRSFAVVSTVTMEAK
jgi:hypothetical protein